MALMFSICENLRYLRAKLDRELLSAKRFKTHSKKCFSKWHKKRAAF